MAAVDQAHVNEIVNQLTSDLSELVNIILDNNPQGAYDSFARYPEFLELKDADAQVQAINKMMDAGQVDIVQDIIRNIPFIPENTNDPELWANVLLEIDKRVHTVPLLNRINK